LCLTFISNPDRKFGRCARLSSRFQTPMILFYSSLYCSRISAFSRILVDFCTVVNQDQCCGSDVTLTEPRSRDLVWHTSSLNFPNISWMQNVRAWPQLWWLGIQLYKLWLSKVQFSKPQLSWCYAFWWRCRPLIGCERIRSSEDNVKSNGEKPICGVPWVNKNVHIKYLLKRMRQRQRPVLYSDHFWRSITRSQQTGTLSVNFWRKMDTKLGKLIHEVPNTNPNYHGWQWTNSCKTMERNGATRL